MQKLSALATRGRVRSFLLATMAILVAAFSPLAAHATDPTPAPPMFDYAGMATQSKADLTAGVGSYVLVVFSIMIGLVVLGLAMRWIKKAAKSS